MNVPGEAPRQGPADMAVANARRVQESLRVMEELSKAPGLDLDAEPYRRARFSLYDVEKSLVGRLLRQDRLERLRGLYVIIDTTVLAGRDPAAVAAQAIAGGASVIQLRHKEDGKREMLAAARELKELCAEKGVLFIVNDNLDIALAVDADGLHVGQEDLPVAYARRLLPQDKLLGCSARTVADAVRAQADGADYLGVGAMYPTSTAHVNTVVVGPERLREVEQAVRLPLAAIGGIDASNVRAVMEAGAAAAAVISAVLGAEDVTAAARNLTNIIQEVSGG
jgi:thiamine-phosphate pyrophosphorylase